MRGEKGLCPPRLAPRLHPSPTFAPHHVPTFCEPQPSLTKISSERLRTRTRFHVNVWRNLVASNCRTRFKTDNNVSDSFASFILRLVRVWHAIAWSELWMIGSGEHRPQRHKCIRHTHHNEYLHFRVAFRPADWNPGKGHSADLGKTRVSGGVCAVVK